MKGPGRKSVRRTRANAARCCRLLSVFCFVGKTLGYRRALQSR